MPTGLNFSQLLLLPGFHVIMKTSHILSFAVFVAGATLLNAGDSKRTADYILATPADFEGKAVTLDVSFVKPVHWKSPLPDFAFFHAATLDLRDYRPGGNILVAIAAGDAGKFSQKYGLEFKGRNVSRILTGTLIAAPGRGPGGGGVAWLIDTTGKVSELIKEKKFQILQDDGPQNGGAGFGPRGKGPRLN